MVYDRHYVNISPSCVFILPEGVLKLVHFDLLDVNARTMYNPLYYYSPEKIACFQREIEEEEE